MQAPKITPELKKAVTLALALQTFEAEITPTVQAYQQEILDRHQWHIAKHWVTGDSGKHRCLPDQIITKPSDSFLLNDEDSAVYFAELEKAKLANGWGHLPKDTCPLLMAQYRKMEAGSAVLRAAQYITDIDPTNIYDMKLRRQLLELAINFVSAAADIDPNEGMTLFAVYHHDLPPRDLKTDADRQVEAIAWDLYARLYNEFDVIDTKGAIAQTITDATGDDLTKIVNVLQDAIAKATDA